MNLSAITIEHHTVGSATCEAGDWHEESYDTAGFPALASHAARHAMSTGHTVTEHQVRSITVRPA